MQVDPGVDLEQRHEGIDAVAPRPRLVRKQLGTPLSERWRQKRIVGQEPKGTEAQRARSFLVAGSRRSTMPAW